jgi:hypothetical protein
MEHTEFEQYDIEVELTLFTPEEGGRERGFSGEFYGPHIAFGGYEWLAHFTLQNREALQPGETARAFVTFFFRPQDLLGKLQPGLPFLLHEGYHPIGTGRVLTILNFEQHAEEARRQEETSALHSDQTRKPILPPWERPRHQPRKKKKKQK